MMRWGNIRIDRNEGVLAWCVVKYCVLRGLELIYVFGTGIALLV